jgi:hypothetical protein
LIEELYEMMRGFMLAPAVTGFEEKKSKLIVEEFSRHYDVVEIFRR